MQNGAYEKTFQIPQLYSTISKARSVVYSRKHLCMWLAFVSILNSMSTLPYGARLCDAFAMYALLNNKIAKIPPRRQYVF